MLTKSIAPLLLLSSLSVAFAYRQDGAPPPCCEKSPPPCCNEQPQPPPCCGKTMDCSDQPPPPPCCCPTHVFIEADFLYWLAKQEGNTYATTGNAITVPGTLDPNTGLVAGPITSGRVYAPHPRAKPGFKVGVGIDFEYGNWELFSEYSYLFSKAKGSVSSNNLNSGILPIYSYTPHNSILSHATYSAPSGATGFVSEASSHWHLHFHNINLELKKTMQLFKSVSLRPHFGLQGSWQKQKFQPTYTVASTTAFSTILGNNRVLVKQEFWGVGLRLGLDSTWKCSSHFGLYANSAFSALWSHFHTRGSSYDTNLIAGYSDLPIGNTSYRLHTISPVIQLEAGVQFTQTFWDQTNDRHQFLMQVGWEEQIWLFQAQYSTSIADTSLILQGLTVRFRFDF